MASLSTFGSTLTDLQSGMNAAQGLEYQRSNFQNQIHAQQMADQLRARSEQQRTQAQRDAALAQIIESRNARTQQGSQFDAEMQNRLALAQVEATSREKVATIGAGARGMDPRFVDTLARIQAANNEQQNDVAYKRKLSDQRKAAVAARDQIKKNQGFFDFKEPNDPQWKQLNEIITKLDAQAITLGIAPAADGGYVVPDFTPMQMPAMLDPRYQLNLGGRSPASVTPVTPDPLSAYIPSDFGPATRPQPAVPPAALGAYSNGQPYEWNFSPPVSPPVAPPPARKVWRRLPDGRTVLAP